MDFRSHFERFEKERLNEPDPMLEEMYSFPKSFSRELDRGIDLERQLDLGVLHTPPPSDKPSAGVPWWAWVLFIFGSVFLIAVLVFPSSAADYKLRHPNNFPLVPTHISEVPTEELFEAFDDDVAAAETARRKFSKNIMG